MEGKGGKGGIAPSKNRLKRVGNKMPWAIGWIAHMSGEKNQPATAKGIVRNIGRF